ncbi:PH domain-containing protein [Paenibacillus campinasensis]|nr:PH domain-containing protein [Paenibacillus campinasensis]
MPSVEEIQKQVELLEYGNKLGKKAEIKELSKFLLPEEKIIAIARGRYSKVTGSIVATDSRVILINKITFGGSKFEDFHYSKITSIENEKVPPLLLGKIKINVAGNEATIDQMKYEESQYISKLIRERIEQRAGTNQVKPSENDVFAKLEKLKELYEKKILTEEEYQAKKNELLSSI